MPGRLQLKPDAVPTIFKDQNQRVIQKSGSGRPAFEKRRRKEVSVTSGGLYCSGVFFYYYFGGWRGIISVCTRKVSQICVGT